MGLGAGESKRNEFVDRPTEDSQPRAGRRITTSARWNRLGGWVSFCSGLPLGYPGYVDTIYILFKGIGRVVTLTLGAFSHLSRLATSKEKKRKKGGEGGKDVSSSR